MLLWKYKQKNTLKSHVSNISNISKVGFSFFFQKLLKTSGKILNELWLALALLDKYLEKGFLS